MSEPLTSTQEDHAREIAMQGAAPKVSTNTRRRAYRIMLRARRVEVVEAQLRAANAEIAQLRKRLNRLEGRLTRNTAARKRLAATLCDTRRQVEVWRHRAVPPPMKGCACVRCRTARAARAAA